MWETVLRYYGIDWIALALNATAIYLLGKKNCIVISTSGWHTDRIIKMAEKYPNIGIRVSIEGLSQKNDDLRGREGSFDRAMRLLLTLKDMGVKDIGYGCTVSNKNSEDMLWLYKLSRELGMEFATAAFHNSYYCHKDDNEITNKDEVIGNFHKLIEELLKDNSPKSWYRAFFNLGLINYIRGNPRMLPCEAGTANFFIEPYGDVFPCNGLEDRYWKESMGNIREVSSFDELWFSEQDGRIGAPELIAAVKWAGACLRNPDDLLQGAADLPLSAINEATPEGRQALAAARQILVNLGKPEATVVTLEDLADTAKILEQTRFNGDGIIPPDAAEDPATAAVIADIITVSVQKRIVAACAV